MVRNTQQKMPGQLGEISVIELLVRLASALIKALATPKVKDVLHGLPAVKAFSLRIPLEPCSLLAVSPEAPILESPEYGSVLSAMLAHGSVVGDEVDAVALLESTPSITDRATKTTSDDVRDVPLQVLLGTIDRVKLDSRVLEDLELSVEIGTAFVHPVQKKLNLAHGCWWHLSMEPCSHCHVEDMLL